MDENLPGRQRRRAYSGQGTSGYVSPGRLRVDTGAAVPMPVAGVFAAEQGVKEGLKGDGDGACPGCCGQRSIWEEKQRRRCKIKQLSAWPRVSAGGHGCGAVAHHSIHRVAT
jgi:hypothetical protein